VANITNTDGTVHVDSTLPGVENTVMSNLDVETPIPSYGDAGKKCYVSVAAAIKIRALALVADLVSNNDSTFEFFMEKTLVKVKKRAGCPLMCGLLITVGKSTLQIGSQMKDLVKRRISIVGPANAILQRFMDWFGFPEGGDSGVRFGNWLDFLSSSTDLTWKLSMERLSWLPNLIFCLITNQDYCARQNMLSKQFLARVARVNQLKLNPFDWETVMSHKITLCKYKGWLSNKWQLFGVDGLLFEWDIKEENISNHILEIISLMDQTLKGVEEVEGTLLPLSKHLDLNTQTGQMLKEQLVWEKLAEVSQKGKSLWVSHKTRDMFRGLLQTEYPSLAVNVTGAPVSGSGVEEVLENIMVLSCGEVQSGFQIGYAGSMSHIPGHQGKYHITLVKPANHRHYKPRWMESMNYTKTLIDEYYSQPRKTVNHSPITNEGEFLEGHLMLGINLSDWTREELRVKLDGGVSKIVGWIPNLDAGPNNFFQMISKGIMHYKGDNYTRGVRTWLPQHIQQGRLWPLDDNRHVVVKVITTVMEHKLIHLTVQVRPDVIYKHVNSQFKRSNEITVNLPWFTLELDVLAKTRKLWSLRKFTVNSRLFDLTRMRLMTGDDSLESALNFVRVQGSTFTITDTYIEDYSDIDVSALLDTAYVAHYFHHNSSDKYLMFMRALLKFSDSSVLTKLLLSASESLFGLVNDHLDSVTAILNSKELKTALISGSILSQIQEIQSLVGEAKVKLTTNLGTLLEYSQPEREVPNRPRVEKDPVEVAFSATLAQTPEILFPNAGNLGPFEKLRDSIGSIVCKITEYSVHLRGPETGPYAHTFWNYDDLDVVTTECILSWVNKGMRVILHHGLPVDRWPQLGDTELHPVDFSEWVKLSVLNEYGGIWFNPSVIITGDLTKEWDWFEASPYSLAVSGTKGRSGSTIVDCALMFGKRSSAELKLALDDLNVVLPADEFELIQLMVDQFPSKAVKAISRDIDRSLVNSFKITMFFSLFITKHVKSIIAFESKESTEVLANTLADKTLAEVTKCLLDLTAQEVVEANYKVNRMNEKTYEALEEIMSNDIELYKVSGIKLASEANATAHWNMLEGTTRLVTHIPLHLNLIPLVKRINDAPKPKILIVTIGSTGDIMPYTPAVPILKQMGFEVILCTHYDLGNQIGADHIIPMPTNSKHLTEQANRILNNPLKNIESGTKHYRDLSKGVLSILELDLHNVVGLLTSEITPMKLQLMQRYSCPTWVFMPFPMVPILDDGKELFSNMDIIFGEVGHALKNAHLANIDLKNARTLRDKTLETKKVDYRGVICTFEPCVLESLSYTIKDPCHYVGHELNSLRVTTSVELMNFVNRDKRRKAILTMGSITTLETALTLLRAAKYLIKLGWSLIINSYKFDLNQMARLCESHLESEPDSYLIVTAIDYTKVAPLVHLLVCHGGSGTVHAALKNKLPVVVMPQFGDQYIWAKAVNKSELGCSLYKEFTDPEIEEALIRLDLSYVKIKSNVERLNFIQDKDLLRRVLVDTFNTPTEVVTRELKFPKRKTKNSVDNPLTDVPIGVSFVKLQHMGTLYNPNVNGFCVSKCLLHSWPSLMQQVELRPSNQGACLSGESVTRKQLIEGLLSMSHNLLLLTNPQRHVVAYKGCHTWPTVILEVQEGQFMDHATVPSVKYMGLEPQGSQITRDLPNLSQFLEYELEGNFSDNMDMLLHQLSNYQIWSQLINKRTYGDLKARVVGVNLSHLHKRTRESWLVVECHQGPKSLVLPEQRSLINLEIVKVLGEQNSLALVVQSEGCTHLLTEAQVDSRSLILEKMHTSIKLKKSVRKLLSKTSPDLVCLNEKTRSYCNVHRVLGYTNVLAASAGSINCLLIREYDNREHHWGNEKKFLEAATELRWLGEPVTLEALQDIHDSFNEPQDRLCYHNGCLMKAIEFTTTNLAKWFFTMNSLYDSRTEKEGTTCYYVNPLNDQVAAMVMGLDDLGNKKGYEDEPDLGLQPEKMLRMMHSTAVDTWLDHELLNTSTPIWAIDEDIEPIDSWWKSSDSNLYYLAVKTKYGVGVYLGSYDVVLINNPTDPTAKPNSPDVVVKKLKSPTPAPAKLTTKVPGGSPINPRRLSLGDSTKEEKNGWDDKLPTYSVNESTSCRLKTLSDQESPYPTLLNEQNQVNLVVTDLIPLSEEPWVMENVKNNISRVKWAGKPVTKNWITELLQAHPNHINLHGYIMRPVIIYPCSNDRCTYWIYEMAKAQNSGKVSLHGRNFVVVDNAPNSQLVNYQAVTTVVGNRLTLKTKEIGPKSPSTWFIENASPGDLQWLAQKCGGDTSKLEWLPGAFNSAIGEQCIEFSPTMKIMKQGEGMATVFEHILLPCRCGIPMVGGALKMNKPVLHKGPEYDQLETLEPQSYELNLDGDVIPNNKWGLKIMAATTVSAGELSEQDLEKLKDVTALEHCNLTGELLTSDTPYLRDLEGHLNKLFSCTTDIKNPTVTGSTLEVVPEWVAAETIDMWEDKDLTDWLAIYAPFNHSYIRCKEHPEQVKEVIKYCMTKYPERSRPVFTTATFEEGRSIVGRLKSVLDIRTVSATPSVTEVINDIKEAYLLPTVDLAFREFQRSPLTFTAEDVKSWVKQSKAAPLVLKNTIKLLAEEILNRPLSDVNIHLKMESLLKDEPIGNWRQQQARIIVWQRKSVCALYSNIFKKAKDRLKSILRDNVLYTDGLTPSQINAVLRSKTEVRWFFENDLAKQDRQTDKHIIEVEMEMYRLLGVHPAALLSWASMHQTWRFKSNLYRGTGESMRLTGQATTALGNFITNMQVHARFYKLNRHSLRMLVMLGDDSCGMFSDKPETSGLKQFIATSFNMSSKNELRNNYASYCGMIIYPVGHGRVEMGPDVVRMRHRFEVTNGESDPNHINMVTRSLSYLMSLGLTTDVAQFVADNDLPIKPTAWYDFNQMAVAVGHKYSMSNEEVINNYNSLLNSISSPNIYEHKFKCWSSVAKYKSRF